MIRNSLLILFLASSFTNFAQIGGLHVYEFLNLASSARITSLGGNLITVRDDDVALAFSNPSLLNQSMDDYLSFNHNFHVAGINNSYVGFSKFQNKLDLTFHAGMKYISYGEFVRRDVYGDDLGQFKASEFAFVVGAGKEIYDRLSFGVNAKLVNSYFDAFRSSAVLFDIAGTYFDTTSQFTATILFKNMGSQITTFKDGVDESLPFEIQVGISKRLKYLPFRFSLIYHHFDRWNILFDDPNAEDSVLFIGENPSDRSASSIWFDNLFRHFIFNGEFLFGKFDNFRLRFGYNHFMRKELTVENVGSFAGFSLGIGLKIKKFRIDYGMGTYHLGGSINHFSIGTNLSEFKN